jgi:hypothetical protein
VPRNFIARTPRGRPAQASEPDGDQQLVPISSSLPPWAAEQVKAISAAEYRPCAAFVRMAVIDFLQRRAQYDEASRTAGTRATA